MSELDLRMFGVIYIVGQPMKHLGKQVLLDFVFALIMSPDFLSRNVQKVMLTVFNAVD